jgi:lysophospholipase L1-like esterase
MNALLMSGYDEGAADHALPAFRQWLLWRAEELRAEGLHADATWYARVANEIAACLRPLPPEAQAGAQAS